MRTRNYTIDIIRLAAALIVMTGHLLHIKGSTSGFLIGTHIEKVASSGAFAVVVFFGLSGIALRYQTDKFGINIKWLTARFIRLLPVYWVSLFVPIAGCYLIGVHISYPLYGFLMSAFGLQALVQSVAFPPVNGPLWSLSVEIYLSASLLLFGHRKSATRFLILLFLIFVAMVCPRNPILQGLPIFYFGYLLPGIQSKLKRVFLLRFAIAIIPLMVLVVFPGVVQGEFGRIGDFLLCSTLAGLVLVTSLFFPKPEKSICSIVSQRSYSLYATHAPVLLFVDKTLFAETNLLSAKQFTISLALILAATEIIYRFVEVPSIKFSRRYLELKLMEDR